MIYRFYDSDGSLSFESKDVQEYAVLGDHLTDGSRKRIIMRDVGGGVIEIRYSPVTSECTS